MRETIKKIINVIAYTKFYIQRSSSYLSVVNASMILFLLLSNLNERGIIVTNLDKYYIAILVFGFFMLISFGALDIHIFKANQREQVLNFKYNPAMMELKKDLREIKEEIKKLK